MSLTVLINGASGKMGSLSVATLSKNPNFNKVISATKNDNLQLLLEKHQPDLAVDFTLPDCVFENAITLIENNIRPVIGASGLNAQQISELQQKCATKKLGGIIAPNFSLSAALMMQYATNAANYFSQIEIIEAHHTKKIDAPSATALQTANLIANAVKKSDKKNITNNTEPAARGQKESNCHIHSLRIDGCFAEQKVIFAGPSEQLIIEQKASDRAAMMPGLIIACLKVINLEKLVYGLENILTAEK